MVYAHAIAGDPRAARFVHLLAPKDAPEIAASIMKLKLKALLEVQSDISWLWRISAVVPGERD